MVLFLSIRLPFVSTGTIGRTLLRRRALWTHVLGSHIIELRLDTRWNVVPVVTRSH